MEIKSSAYFLKMNFLPNGTLHLQEKIVLRKNLYSWILWVLHWKCNSFLTPRQAKTGTIYSEFSATFKYTKCLPLLVKMDVWYHTLFIPRLLSQNDAHFLKSYFEIIWLGWICAVHHRMLNTLRGNGFNIVFTIVCIIYDDDNFWALKQCQIVETFVARAQFW